MADPAHKYSDEQIAAFQREVASVYKRYMAEAKARLSDYLAKHEALDEQKRQLVEDGLLSKQDYASWRRMTVAVGKQYNAAVNEAAQCYTKANQIAVAALNDRLPAVYAENMNYQTYKVESGIGINTAFTLQDADTVQNMLKDSSAYVSLPQRKVQVAKDVAWNKRQIGSYIQQGIFMGESIPKIAKRVSQEVGASNMKAATRIARTSVTAAESAGRLSALERAKALGIDCKIEWLATLDGRTRHSHRIIDGEQVEVGEKFSNGCRYPGDPDAPYAETANCRCTVVAGFDDADNSWKDEASKRLMGQNYDDWKVSSAEAEIARLERSKARLNKSGGFYDPISGEFYSVSQHRKSAARIAEIKSDLKDSISSPAPWDSEDDIAEYKAYLKALKKYEGDAIKYADASARQEKLKQTIASIRDKVDERKAWLDVPRIYRKVSVKERKAIESVFNQQPKTAAHEMYEKFVDKLKLQTKRSVDGDYFRREGASRGVHIDLKSDLKKGQIKPIANTWFHEFAHHIDYTSKRGRNKYYSISYRNGSFEKALRQDYANLLKKFGSDIDISIELNSYFPEENFDVSDIIEGITNGRIKGSFGHISQDPHYWTREGGSALPKEAFAEFTSAYITCPSSLYMLKQWFPNADKVYNEIVKEILSKV